MSANCTDFRRCGGFTMTELITVIVLLGILAAVAMPSLRGAALTAELFRDRTASGLRFAQKTAVSHRRTVCVAFAGTAVTFTIATANPAADCPASLPLPDSSGNTVQSNDAAVVVGAAPGNLFFQPDGRITRTISGTAAYSGNLSVGGQAVVVEGATGYVR